MLQLGNPGQRAVNIQSTYRFENTATLNIEITLLLYILNNSFRNFQSDSPQGHQQDLKHIFYIRGEYHCMGHIKVLNIKDCHNVLIMNSKHDDLF